MIFLLLGDGTGDGYGKSLFSCLSVSFSFWGMVAGDGYGKSLGDGYGRWLREVFVFLFFLIFLLSGGWLREMVTGDDYGESLFSFFS